MKLLLDEPVPRRLASCFPDSFDVRTVPEMGWAGRSNGELLELAAASGFDALITVDRGFEYQQNENNLPIAVIVLLAQRNRFQDLRPRVPEIIAILANRPRAQLFRVSA